MHTQTGQHQQGQTGGSLTQEELYDLIMATIEPELTTSQIPLLDAKYANETPEEKKARGQRYAEAFALFEQTFAALQHSWENAVALYHEDALAMQSQRSARDDSQHLQDIGGAINDA